MEEVSDVMSLDAKQVPETKQINVYLMEAVSDVMNLDVKQVHKVKPINV